MEFPHALRAARKAARMTQDQVAEALGVSRVAVTNWERGSNLPETDTVRRLARLLKVSVSALLEARPLMLAEPPARPYRSGGTGEHFPPVIGTAQLGDNGYWLELEHPVGHGDGFVRYPSRDPNAYALRCKGDSMRPRIKPGEFVVVEPNQSYSPGDEVVVRDGAVELASINEDHRPITLDLADIETIHYVAGIFKASLYYADIS